MMPSRSVRLAWTAMSCVTNRTEEPSSRCTSRIMREHALLHDDVERGGRLVGDDEFGPADGGERDRHALAHAAGQLVRIGVEHRGLEVQPLADGLDDGR